MSSKKYAFGDILWCNRELEEFIDQEGHREGPFIVVKGKLHKGYVYAVKGTNYDEVDGHYAIKYNDLILTRKNSPLRKDTHFAFNKVYKVPLDAVVCYLGEINDEQKTLVQKKLLVSLYNGLIEDIGLKKTLTHDQITEGDSFMKDGNRYYVIKVNNDNTLTVIPYEFDNTNDEHKSVFDYDNIKNIILDDTYELVRSYVPEFNMYVHLQYFLHKQSDNIVKYSDEKNLTIGSIIYYHRKLFYISAVEKKSYLCYQLSYTTDEENSLVIDDERFEINFEQRMISASDVEIMPVMHLTEEKTNKIRDLKKLDKYRSKAKPVKQEPIVEKKYLFGKLHYLKGNKPWPYALYEIVDYGRGVFVDLEALKHGKFIMRTYCFNQFDSARRTPRSEFIKYIIELGNTVNDPRYFALLVNNGVYNYKDYIEGKQRTRNSENE